MTKRHDQMTRRRRLPQPGLLVGVIALAAALGGTASALPGSGTVDAGDLKRNAVASKAIKDGGVTAKDLKRSERFHVVGTRGEPKFFNGGEGDCVWKHGTPEIAGTAPVSFRKDVLGQVQLRGVGYAEGGPGGDKDCNPNDPGEAEDGIAFRLPRGYQPEFLDFSTMYGLVAFVPRQGAVIGDASIPGGAVYATFSPSLLLDGAGFAAAPGGGRRAAAAVPDVSLRALERLASSSASEATSNGAATAGHRHSRTIDGAGDRPGETNE